jgi:pilus assembly protein CpaE
VVDLPPAMVDWLTPVLEAADHVLIVSGTSVPFVQQTRRLIDFFKDQNPSLHIEVVVGQEKKPLIRSRRHAEAAKALQTEFKHWLPPDGKVAEDAMDRGRPLSETAGSAPLTKEIAQIAADLVKMIGSRPSNSTASAVRPGR